MAKILHRRTQDDKGKATLYKYRRKQDKKGKGSFLWVMNDMRWLNLLHFGNIQERHLWKKNPKFTFWSLMTSYMVEYLWRHINLKLHQLGYFYVTWPKSRDVISVRYHVIKLIIPENPGNELASFLEKKSRRVWERLGASFLEKNIQKGHFRVIWREK